jgi:hypothetical protein
MNALLQRAGAIARAELGYVEQGGPDGHSGNVTKYGKALGEDGVFWCAEFAWWVWWRAGFDLRQLTGSVASAEALRAAFEWHGALHRTPLVGDLPIYRFPGERGSGANHIGAYITAVHGQYDIEAIEGNTNIAGSRNGGAVLLKRRRAAIVGYGRVTDLLPLAQRPAPAPARIPARIPAPRPSHTPAPYVPEDDDMAQVITADGVAIYVATARHGARHINDQVEAGALVAAGLITLQQLHQPVRVTPAQLQALTTASR